MSAVQIRTPDRRVTLSILLWLLAIGLVYWVVRSVPLQESLHVLRRLGPSQIALLFLVNGLVLLTFSGRWWVLLRALGRPVNYLYLATYRVAAFGVSYFTPGPLLGGEPLQVYLVHQRHHVPAATAIAALTLDKLLEMLVNFIFLVVGVFFVLESALFPPEIGRRALVAAFLLLTLPLLYLGALWAGYRPFTRLLTWRSNSKKEQRVEGSHWVERLRGALLQGEGEVGIFCRSHPGTILTALAISGVSWLGMMGEYWLALRLLGLPLSPAQAIIALTAARIAILLPLPGGLGALEASQVLVLGLLGFSPAAGLSLSLFIRVRDVFIGALGLWIGWRLHQGIQRQHSDANRLTM